MNEKTLLTLILLFLSFICMVNILLFLKNYKNKNTSIKTPRLSQNIAEAMASKIKFESNQHRKKRDS